tara:strand:- start:17418 stop:18185 length:768 start_codon:yes stop_codon:yes gene_type:complete
MTKCELNRNELANFLSSFGPGIDDLRLDVKDNSLVGGVAAPTHFLTKKISVTQMEAGGIVIADLTKVSAFLRACTDEKVEIHQQDRDGSLGNLKLSCGKSVVTLPPTKDVKSSKSLATAMKLVDDATEQEWKVWVDKPLNCYGVIDTNETNAISSLGKVVGADKPYHLSFVADKKEMVIHTGSGVTGQMFHTINLKDASAPREYIKTSFGPWFPDVVSCLPSGNAEIYTGEKNVLVFNHQEKHCLLVVIDQDLSE